MSSSLLSLSELTLTLLRPEGLFLPPARADTSQSR